MSRTLPRSTAVATIAIAALLLTGVASAPAASAAPAPAGTPAARAVAPAIRGADSPGAISGSYLVVLKDTVRPPAIAARARALADGFHGTLGHVWSAALRGFAATMTGEEATKLAAEPDVAYVEQNQRWRIASSQVDPPSWGIDRIDQHYLPLTHNYDYDPIGGSGAGVHAYVIDSGIRITHTDFGGRASYGYDFVDNDAVADDCNGHGTHVAGTIGGTTYGVAKKVQLVALRAFDCKGLTSTLSIADSINWVIAHAIKPAVINLSIDRACVDQNDHEAPCPADFVQSIIGAEFAALNAGIPVVVAAGNESRDACANPLGSAPGALDVGGTDINDHEASGSNLGTCVDIWAPGEDITSDWDGSNTDTAITTGTSMAAPHVTGTIALLMGTPQFASATPDQISSRLLSTATVGVLPAPTEKLLFTQPPMASDGSPVGLARNTNGKLALFGAGKDGYLYNRTQTAAGGASWGSWTRAATKGWFSVAAEPNYGGRIELASVTIAGGIWHRQQAAVNANSWFNWAALPGQLTSVALAHEQDGRLDMFGANQLGQIFYATQGTTDSVSWAPWTQIPSVGPLNAVAAEIDQQSRVVLIAIDSAGTLWQSRQSAPNTDTWPPLAPVVTTGASHPMREVALARTTANTLVLVGTDGAGGVWHSDYANGAALGWTAMKSNVLRHVAAETNANGRIEVIGVDIHGDIWQSMQSGSGSAVYSDWTTVDGQFRS